MKPCQRMSKTHDYKHVKTEQQERCCYYQVPGVVGVVFFSNLLPPYMPARHLLRQKESRKYSKHYYLECCNQEGLRKTQLRAEKKSTNYRPQSKAEPQYLPRALCALRAFHWCRLQPSATTGPAPALTTSTGRDFVTGGSRITT